MGLAQRVAPRIGEGQQIPLTQLPRSNGTTVSFGADFSKAPVPTRRYAADICDVVIHRNDLVIIFGQESVFGGEVDSVLQLRMNPTSVKEFLQSVENSDHDVYMKMIVQLEIPVEPLTSITAKPGKEAKAQVNYICVAMSGFDTCMDFYSASPFAILHLKEHGDLYVEPVARVDMHSALFVSLLNRLRELIPGLRQLKEERAHE